MSRRKGGTGEFEHASSSYVEGCQALARGDLAAAEVLLSNALEVNPDSFEALFALGTVLQRKNRLREAARCLVRAQGLAPEDANLGKSLYALFGQLSERTDPAGGTGSDPDFIDWFARAHDHMSDGDFDAAEQCLRTSCELNPGWPFTHQRLGCIAANRGNMEEADAWFARSAACGLLPDVNICLGGAFLNGLEEVQHPVTTQVLLRFPARTLVGALRLVVFASGDPAYFRRFAHALVNSASRHGNAGLIWHFHLINPDEWIDDEFAELAGRHPEYEFRLSTEARRFTTVEQAKVYFACARYILFPEILRQNTLPVMLVDLDLLILGSLVSLAESLPVHDVALVNWGGHGWQIWDLYWASAVLAGTDDGAKCFFGRVAAYVRYFVAQGKGTWYLDQIALFAAASGNPHSARPAAIVSIPAAACAVHHVSGSNPAPTVIFWSVTYNIKANAPALGSQLFRRYLPRTRRLFGWTLPGTDQVFQEYLAKADVYQSRKSWETAIKDVCLTQFVRRRRALDVGGHIGFWSYWLAAHFDAVDAFEPDPLLQDCFRENVRQPNVILHPCALGSERGGVRIEVDAFNSGMTHVAPMEEGVVPMRPLDDMDLDDIDFIKLDAEGYELFVLKGAVETLRKNRPLVLIEQDERWGARYGQEAVGGLAFLKNLGAAVIARLPDHNYLLKWPD